MAETNPKKPSVTAQIIGGIGAAVGIGLGRAAGLALLIPVVAAVIIGIPLYFLTSGRKRGMVPAGAVQAGHALWMLFGMVLIVAGGVPGMAMPASALLEPLLFLAGAIIIVFWRSLVPILIVTGYQAVTLAMNAVSIAQPRIDTQVRTILAVHIFLRLIGVALMYLGYFHFAKEPLPASDVDEADFAEGEQEIPAVAARPRSDHVTERPRWQPLPSPRPSTEETIAPAEIAKRLAEDENRQQRSASAPPRERRYDVPRRNSHAQVIVAIAVVAVIGVIAVVGLLAVGFWRNRQIHEVVVDPPLAAKRPAAAPAMAVQWQTFTTAEGGGFTASFPGSPTPKSVPSTTTPRTLHSFEVKNGAASFSVAYWDPPLPGGRRISFRR